MFAVRENKRHVLAREIIIGRGGGCGVNADFRDVTGQADQFARAARKIMRHGLRRGAVNGYLPRAIAPASVQGTREVGGRVKASPGR